MNNNLTIANLMKTDWINQFENLQLNEIKDGLQDNLNVFLYATTDFNWKQMKQIRLGLEENLEVSIYANPKYSLQEMKDFRLRLEEGTL